MVPFNKFFSTVFLAVLYATSFVNAMPWPIASKHATHRLRKIGRRGLEVESFHPKASFETYGKGVKKPASFAGRVSREDVATTFAASKLSVDASGLQYRAGYSAGDAEFAYLKQVHEGLTFANTAINVAFKRDMVVSFGSSFVDASKAPSSSPSIPFEDIITPTEEALEGTYNGFESKLEYLARADGSVSLAHVIQIQNEEAGTWYEAFVDANTGEIVSVTDFTTDASYKVLPITKQILPEGLEVLEDPADLEASPNGWHLANGTTTEGNNVVAFKGSRSSVTTQSAEGQVFNFTYDDAVGPTAGENVDAARVNAFYLMNTIHDFSYRYGFTEDAFNFQNDNFGNGGSDGDRVLMSVQDSSGTNNAFFSTPPDGQSGVCRMFIWTLTTPNRDGSLENDIPIHEMTHGITNRMTGGGTGRCLQTTESGGMGEGWSDAMAEWTTLKSAEVPDFVMGQYVINNPAGIRSVPYSTDHTINPLMYSTIAQLGEVHDIGEVWATVLHGLLSALVAEHGFAADAKTNPGGTEGNIVYLHLFMDALALQPCNPTMTEARDAWIQADENRYDGANRCLLWTAFADRGLGPAAADFTDDTSIPSDC